MLRPSQPRALLTNCLRLDPTPGHPLHDHVRGMSTKKLTASPRPTVCALTPRNPLHAHLQRVSHWLTNCALSQPAENLSLGAEHPSPCHEGRPCVLTTWQAADKQKMKRPKTDTLRHPGPPQLHPTNCVCRVRRTGASASEASLSNLRRKRSLVRRGKRYAGCPDAGPERPTPALRPDASSLTPKRPPEKYPTAPLYSPERGVAKSAMPRPMPRRRPPAPRRPTPRRRRPAGWRTPGRAPGRCKSGPSSC